MLNQIVQRACDFEKPKAKSTPPTITTTTTTTTAAYRKAKVEVEAEAKDEAEKEVDRVLVQPVVVEAAYPNLVSNSNNKMNSKKWLDVTTGVQIKLT